MEHDELLDTVKEAANDLFADQSVSREVTKESLNDLVGHIDVMLETL